MIRTDLNSISIGLNLQDASESVVNAKLTQNGRGEATYFADLPKIPGFIRFMRRNSRNRDRGLARVPPAERFAGLDFIEVVPGFELRIVDPSRVTRARIRPGAARAELRIGGQCRGLE